MKSAREKNQELYRRLSSLSDKITMTDCEALRRAALTLHRWGELECGDGNSSSSWMIERDEATGIPFFVRVMNKDGKRYSHRIPDREKSALKRIKRICDGLGLHFYHQTDPRGWPLYVDKEELPENNYSRGIGIGE